MTSPKKLSLEKALHLLRKPDARLVRLHSNDGGAGFYVWPGGGRVPDEVAQLLLGRNDVQPYDSGLFPGHAQSWRLGNWRERAGRGVTGERVMTLGSHQFSVGKSQTHITPRWIIDRLGPFDLDPCAADPRPWDCAAGNVVEAEDGLSQPWRGRVWLNPPFDRYAVGAWIRKLAGHGDGIALLHARTEAAWFEPCWEAARGILFLADRIKFCRPDGSEQPANSGAPPVLVAFGPGALEQIERSGISGALVTSWSWRSGDYDAQGDFAKSLEEGYRAVRERVAAGGPGWVPK